MAEINKLLEKSLAEIKRLKASNDNWQRQLLEPVAVVGASCRYPGNIASMADFWQALKTGVDGIGTCTNQRWPMELFFNEDTTQPGIYTRAMGLLNDIDKFDSGLFGIRAEELKHVDPQHRLLLELTWEALEDAGYPPARLTGTQTGVYVGIMSDDYGQLQGEFDRVTPYIGSGIAKSCAAGRLSFSFGFQGPAIALDTACSSSLVTVHLAVQALRRRECDAAIAGGVNLILSPQSSVVACRSQMLSQRGRCATFDEQADGYVRAEGCGVAMLKRLSDAVADGDQIYALIQGSAVNHDGRSQGFTAPSGQAQRKVINAALADARLEPAAVHYVECHGTGTALGDPVEVRALHASYIQPCKKRNPLVLGALKTNLGHMESAAGIGGLHKVIQILRHREVPRNIHFQRLNPKIDLAGDQIVIAAEDIVLPATGTLYAGVSSFGFSGTNAHLILASYQPPEETAGATQPKCEDLTRACLFKLAAETSEALLEYAQRYLHYLEKPAPVSLRAICYTATVGRADAACRIAFNVESKADLKACLHDFVAAAGSNDMPVPVSSAPVLWMFDAREQHDWSLSCRLYQQYSGYRNPMAEALALMQEKYPACREHFTALLASPNQVTLAAGELMILQALHAYALARLMLHCGLQPSSVVGFGYGEYVAAAIAGLLTLRDLVTCLIEGRITSAVKMGRARYDFFSSLAGQPVSAEHWQAHKPGFAPVDAAVLTACIAKLTRPAKRSDTVQSYIQINISQGLTPVFEKRSEPAVRWLSGNTLRHEADVWENALASLYMAGLNINWLNVYEGRQVQKISLPGYPFQRRRHWTDYGFSFDNSVPSTVGLDDAGLNEKDIKIPVKKSVLPTAFAAVEHRIISTALPCPRGSVIYSGEISLAALPYLQAHRVSGEVVVPASVYIDMIISACHWQQPARWCLRLDNVKLLQACILRDKPVSVLCRLNTLANAEMEVEVYSKIGAGNHWLCHARARVGAQAAVTREVNPATLQSLCPKPVSLQAHYAQAQQAGIEYGPEFRGIEQLSRGIGCALGKIGLPASLPRDPSGFSIHPVLLDACLQTIFAAVRSEQEGDVFVPSAIQGMHYFAEHFQQLRTGELPENVWCFVRITPEGEGEWESDQQVAGYLAGRSAFFLSLGIYDTAGNTCIAIDRFEISRYSGGTDGNRETGHWRDWIYEKVWAAAAPPKADSRETEAAHWILFSDRDMVSESIERELTQRGDKVTLVRRPSAKSLVQAEKKCYLFEPDSPRAVAELFAAITESEGAVRGVIYAWSLQATGLAGDTVPEALTLAARFPLFLCQAVLDSHWRELELTFLTSRAQPVAGDDVDNPLQALLWGHLFSFINENEIYSRLIDVDAIDSQQAALSGAAVVTELKSGDREECQIAIRAGQRYVTRLGPTSLQERSETRIKADACYLVTGGLGALGLQTAAVLAEQGAKHIILMGRRERLPENNDTLQQLQQKGAEVYYLRADAGDYPALADGLECMLDSLPPMRGVVHSVGVLDDGVIARQTWERYLTVLEPKVLGALNLHHFTQGFELDFFIQYSSLSAILGNPGQGNYAAANAFLDSFSCYRRRRGLPGLSINWGAWSDIGVAAERDIDRKLEREQSLLGSIPLQQGLEVIRRQFTCDNGQFTMVPIHTQQRFETQRQSFVQKLLADVVQFDNAAEGNAEAGGGDTGLLKRLVQVAANERDGLLIDYLRNLVSRLLENRPAIDSRASLFDLGLDSLLAIDLRKQLEQEFHCKLHSTLLFDYPSIDDLSGYLLETFVAEQVQEEQPVQEKNIEDVTARLRQKLEAVRLKVES